MATGELTYAIRWLIQNPWWICIVPLVIVLLIRAISKATTKKDTRSEAEREATWEWEDSQERPDYAQYLEEEKARGSRWPGDEDNWKRQ